MLRPLAPRCISLHYLARALRHLKLRPPALCCLVLPDGKQLGGIEDNNKNRREVQDFLATL